MKRWTTAVVVLVLAALAVWWSVRVEPKVPASPEATRDEREAAKVESRADPRTPRAQQPPHADAGAAPGGSAPTGITLERPPPPPADHPLRPVPREPPPGHSGPTDRRGGNNPNAARELEILSYAFETLDDDVAACLAEWRKTEPNLAPARVMIGFEIDASGLQRAWVERDADLPLGVKSCFANAVYGLDWSHVVEQPAKITKDFDLGGDAGP